MKPPCAKCPFRRKYMGDNDYLRTGRRADIAQSILEGGEFPCHETVDYDGEEDDEGFNIPDTRGSTPCIGLDLVQLRAGRAAQMLRIRERIGTTDTAELLRRGRNISLWTWDEVLADGRPDEDGESCSICAQDCEAPAGYLIGGEVIHGTEFLTEDDICPTCGEYVCSSCMFHPEHECITPRPQRRSPRPLRKDRNAITDREPVELPKVQRSAPRGGVT